MLPAATDDVSYGTRIPSEDIQHPSMNHHEFGDLLHVDSHADAPRPTEAAPRLAANFTGFTGSLTPLPRRTTTASRLAPNFNGSDSFLHPLPRRGRTMAYRPTDPKHRHAFRALNGYWGVRNSHDRLDCFGDCKAKRWAAKGVNRRSNMVAHLRHYHGQDIQRGGW